MDDLKEMVEKYTTQQDWKIKKICAPLRDYLGISYFDHFSIDQDGTCIDICNNPEALEFYYHEKLYMEDPYLSHPFLLQSGNLLVPNCFNANFLNSICKQSRLRHLFLMINANSDKVEGSCFGLSETDLPNIEVFYANIDLLHKFISYFKKESKPIIEKMRNDHFSLKKAKGKAFSENTYPAPLLKKDPNVEKFLKLICPLSRREHQCLALFKQGHSAESTGVTLGLSRRTVESYFDNIKIKLKCSSKAELLEW